MPKTKISEFSATANSNTDINSINIAEGCAPSNINDAIRELMAELKDFQAGTKGDSFNGPVGSTTAAAGAFTTLSSTGNTTLGDASGDTVTINGTATFANANPTLSAGTANGVLYLSGSKVATSGSALTFDGTNFALGAGGDIRAYNTANTRYGRFATTADGTVLESFNGAGEPLILSAPQSTAYVGFKVNGSEQARINTTGLGIGTSSPSYKLDVSAAKNTTNIKLTSTGLSSADDYTQLSFGDASNIYGAVRLGYNNPAATSASYLAFYNNTGSATSERMRLDAAGNLGLGVTPSAWSGQTAFQTNGGSLATSGTGVLNLTQNAYYNGSSWTRTNALAASMLQQSGGAFNFFTAGSSTAGSAITFTQAMTLDANGNLGVNTTATNYGGYKNLAISGTSGGNIDLMSGSTIVGNIYNTSADVVIQNSIAGPLRFSTNGSERARIDSSGNLLVGRTSLVGSERLSVEGSQSTFIVRTRNTASSNPSGMTISYTGASPNNAGNEFIYCEDSSAVRMTVRANGGISNYSANDANLSDRREKTNFAPAKNYLDTICAIPVQTFNYIDQSEEDPGTTLGVVAQDVQAVAPELVMESNWGTEENPKMRLSIYQTDLQYALMKALQELKAEFDAYKATHP